MTFGLNHLSAVSRLLTNEKVPSHRAPLAIRYFVARTRRPGQKPAASSAA